MKAVLCDQQFVKAGVALDNDMMALYEVWGGLKARSPLDLGLISSNNNTRSGLKTLTRLIVGIDLPTSRRMLPNQTVEMPGPGLRLQVN